MASSPLDVLAAGAVVDVVVSGGCAAPLQAIGLGATRGTATCCVASICMWAERRAWWMPDAGEVMPWCSLHGACQAAPRGWSVSHMMSTLRAILAHASRRGVSARVVHWQRPGARARRMTLEHDCANVCRSVWYVGVRSCVSTSFTVRITRESDHARNFPWWVEVTGILTRWTRLRRPSYEELEYEP
jgi:hypothetical protein